MKRVSVTGISIAVIIVAVAGAITNNALADPQEPRDMLREVPDDPYLPPPSQQATSPAQVWSRNGFDSIQVNVDANGNNIIGDAANEPSIAVDPTDRSRIAIGWRQFDTIASNFRQAGWSYSHNSGQTWTFPGVIEPGIFRSDPVLDADADGNLYYYSLTLEGNLFVIHMFKSTDGGVTWGERVFGAGGDKAWMTIDRTDGPGRGHIYAQWNGFFSCCPGDFTRSTDGGASFEPTLSVPNDPFWGTLSVGPDGELYVCGNGFVVLRSDNAQDAAATPTFNQQAFVNLDGTLGFAAGPNPAGLLGQTWIATDHSDSPTRGNVYLLASVNPSGVDPLDVMFARSTDGGVTWSDPVRVNDDLPNAFVWQWFGTMSVAPNGRIDAIWNDTRNTGSVNMSELHYSFSTDGGLSWSPNIAISPAFNSHIGWPRQNKIGDYYDMVSDLRGADLAYSATFNGEQDVYYLRISADCNENGVFDDQELADNLSPDCDGNLIPDECDIADGRSEDCDADGVPDECQTNSDSDSHIDPCDNCPQATNEDQADTDGDGKGDACDSCPLDFLDDRDGDGVCDSDDECFDDPAKVNPGQCGCNLPDFDTDGDGVADCNDKCAGVDNAIFGPECETAIPTVGAWGLVVLTLLLLVAGKIWFRSPRMAV